MQDKKVLKILSVLFVLFLQINSGAYCQKKLSFQSLHDGLSNNHIKCIFQDSKGFMWFGTYDGLNKFDGNNFVTYENSPSDSNSLCHNYINAIIEDKYKNIWIGTSNGLDIYNRNNDHFSTIHQLHSYTFLCITVLFFDDLDNLWIGTSGNGLIIYNIKNQKVTSFTSSITDEKTISSNFVTGIVKDRYNRIWIGTRSGLNLFDYKNKIFKHFVHDDNNPESLSQNNIMVLKTDNSGDVWIATYGGGVNQLGDRNDKIIFKHYDKNNTTHGLSNNYILSLCPDRKGNLWIGTENGGLNYLNESNGIIDHYYAEDGNPQALISNSIWAVYEDKDGIVWIGTYDKGINIIDENFDKFELFQKNNSTNKRLTNNDIKCFAQDHYGIIWIATDGGGIFGFNPATRQFLDFPGNNKLSTNSVISLLIDNKGNFWAGTWAFGIDKFDKNGNKIRNYKCSLRKGSGGNISCLFQDKKNDIFAGTSGNGLFRYNSINDNFIPVIYDTPNSHLNGNSYISVIKEDSQNNIWIGTFFGLTRITPSESGNYKFTQCLQSSNPTSLSSSLVKSIFEDSRKRIWIGTENGLDMMTDTSGSFIHYNQQSGLPNNSINSILEDEHHNLWLGTNKGISKFNPSTLTFKNFTKEDGLNSNEFSLGACLKTFSGSLVFGGPDGFNMFNPDSIKFNTRVPSVYITDIKISNCPVKIGAENSPLQKNISETSKITLTHKQNSFTIEFVAINYTRSERNQYKYLLEGFDKTWVHSGTQHMVTYTNLDAGTYKFKVMGSNNDGVWNKMPSILEITVLPPFWETTWAYLLYILVFGLLLFGFLRLWMIKTEQAQKLKFEKIQRENEEELNKLKIQFFTNVSHELRTPLTLIISPLEHIVSLGIVTGKLKQQLSLAFKNTERLFRLVNELMDFSKFEENKLKLFVKQFDIINFTHEISYLFTDEAQLKQIKFSFESDTDSLLIWADKNKLEKVFTNLLSNAFKFTPENGFIMIRMDTTTNSNAIHIEFINSGPGISSQYIDKIFDRFYQVPDKEINSYSGTGIGLALVKNIIDLHHGTISVTSIINHETCFTVSLLLGNEHFDEADIIKESDSDKTSNRKLTSPLKKADSEHIHKLPVILIIEDNTELRTYLVSILNEEYQIAEAPDGETGLMLAAEKNPDLIISDIIMPKVSGIELCKRIKGDIATSHIPVILLTSKDTIENQIEGIEIGADTYITKPFNVTHLLASVKNLIETRRRLFQRFSQEVYLLPKEVTTNKYDQKFLEHAIEYISTNIENEDISVEGLAASLTMNRSNVYRKIKALTGQSATEFIRTIRLKMAIKYLEAGEYNISEISYKVGINSPAYFTKCFKEHFGKLPSEFLSKNTLQKDKNSTTNN
jgi:ligand-binding sensor domain-containing protein/signal transduction histidine kinase/DNA-binding response OmpR family regulator